jgi:hypothetical protein
MEAKTEAGELSPVEWTKHTRPHVTGTIPPTSSTEGDEVGSVRPLLGWWILLRSVRVPFPGCAGVAPGERLLEAGRASTTSLIRPSPDFIEEPFREAMALEGWTTAVIPGCYPVDSHRVHATPEADAEGQLSVGIYATVTGIARPDGSVEAEAPEVLRRPRAERE